MDWIRLTPSDYVTACWSGGTTTQLAIGPERTLYAERNFLWRLSSARVNLPHSDFTPLPGYHRFLSVLEGDLEIRAGDAPRSSLPRLRVLSFDGGVPVESWGTCTDFNLMVRKGLCTGSLKPLLLGENAPTDLRFPEETAAARRTLALFCLQGRLSLPETGLSAGPGELLLCRNAPAQTPAAAGSAGAQAMAAFIAHA